MGNRVQIAVIRAVMNERHERYHEREGLRTLAIQDALKAAKEAVVEAKAAQDSYNHTHNDLVRKMERQTAEMMPREQVNLLLGRINDDIKAVSELTQSMFNQTIGKDKLLAYLAAAGAGGGILATMIPKIFGS